MTKYIQLYNNDDAELFPIENKMKLIVRINHENHNFLVLMKIFQSDEI